MDSAFYDISGDHAFFTIFLDLFFSADSVDCFEAQPHEDELIRTMTDMVAGRLSSAEVHELFRKVKSDPSAIARLAELLQKTKASNRKKSKE
jgi:hypothetical protein